MAEIPPRGRYGEKDMRDWWIITDKQFDHGLTSFTVGARKL
jgi:hypothetical protein